MPCTCDTRSLPTSVPLLRPEFSQAGLSASLPGRMIDAKSMTIAFTPVFLLAPRGASEGVLLRAGVTDEKAADLACVAALSAVRGAALVSSALVIEGPQSAEITELARANRMRRDLPLKGASARLMLAVREDDGVRLISSPAIPIDLVGEPVHSGYLLASEATGWHIFDCASEWYWGGNTGRWTACVGTCPSGSPGCLTSGGKPHAYGEWVYCWC